MFTSFSNPFSVSRLARPDPRPIDIPPVPVHEVETAAEKRPRTLKHLLKANHINYSILYHHLQFHNHNPHILGSAYILGASAERLNAIYDSETRELEPWTDAPGEISRHDWREFLGKKEYQRAYIDFFEDQLVQYGYDWRKLLHDYLFEGERPLINCVVSGLGHPLIHLAYAYELSSHTLAVEALVMICCAYSYIHKYLDDPSYTKPASYSSTSPLDILRRVALDPRLEDVDFVAAKPGADAEPALLDHWNAWRVDDDGGGGPKARFAEAQRVAAGLLAATGTRARSGTAGRAEAEAAAATATARDTFDFFLVHALTTSHAVRVLLGLVPGRWQIPLVRQWWLLVLSVYVMRDRPEIEMERIEGYELDGRGWEFVIGRATGRDGGEKGLDAHYVKGLRALKEAADTWGDGNDLFFLKAATKFAVEFEEWEFMG